MNIRIREAAFFFLVSLALTLVGSSANAHAQQSRRVYIYIFPDSVSSERISKYFNDRPDWEVTFYNLSKPAYSDRFLEMMRTLVMSGVEVVPEGPCLPCLLYHYKWEQIMTMFGSPLIKVFHDGRLTAITVGISGLGTKECEILNQALMVDSEYVKVFTSQKVYDVEVLSDEDVRVDIVSLPFLGEIDLSSTPLFVVTAAISLADGFNPCSLWVLMLLLGIVVYSGSRRRVVLVGLTFLIVTATVYGLFMLGLFSVFLYTGYLTWIRIVVAIAALVFGLVNIKDYFWFGRGVSFTIPDRYKPKIFKSIRGIMNPKSFWAILSGTAIMALGATLVELPCTVGFPLVWTKIVTEHNVGPVVFASLLSLYIVVFLLDEIAVFASVTVTLKASRLEEKHARMLKLVSGMIMATLALVLIVNPELMGSIDGSILVLGVAAILALSVILIHRKVLPEREIRMGTKETMLQRK